MVISEYFDLAKIKVLPPRKLYHPILPYRSKGKLLFPLCKICADNGSQRECMCNDENRMLLGCWTTIEIQKAVEMGYQIHHIYEVYHWENTSQYDPKMGEGGLFAGYSAKSSRWLQAGLSGAKRKKTRISTSETIRKERG